MVRAVKYVKMQHLPLKLRKFTDLNMGVLLILLLRIYSTGYSSIVWVYTTYLQFLLY